VVSNLDDVSFSSQRTEDNDGDANDFHLGTGGLPAAQATNGDDECYGRGFIGVTNCWGAYDGHNNMYAKTVFFSHLYIKTIILHQDRFGTNIGKTQKRLPFSQVLAHERTGQPVRPFREWLLVRVASVGLGTYSVEAVPMTHDA
jgi:hypothetical protein